MKSVLAAAALIALAGSPAFAQTPTPTWPHEWLGPWCLVELHSPTTAAFERGATCEDLVFHSNGYEAPDRSCTLLAGHDNDGVFTALVACNGDIQHRFHLQRFFFHPGANPQLMLMDKLQNASAIVEGEE